MIDGSDSGEIDIVFQKAPLALSYEFLIANGKDEAGELIWGTNWFSTTRTRNNVVSNLTPTQIYHVKVRSLNSQGKSAWSQPVSLVVR